MATVGRALLILGLAVAVYGIAASLHGARTGRRAWIDSGRRSMYAIAALMTAAFLIIEVAFLRSDFSYNIVASASSTTTPTFYKAAAVWSTQQGSLLLWVFLLSLWSSLALFLTRRRVREIAPFATAILLGFCSFFLALTILFANPFSTTANPPSEGAGLDPLLRHTTMMIHPPMVYTGGSRSRAGSPSPRGCVWGSGSCSARAGPTPSSDGAGTGHGTRSRTPP